MQANVDKTKLIEYAAKEFNTIEEAEEYLNSIGLISYDIESISFDGTPRQSVFPSSVELHKSCIPKQIPKSGCFTSIITLSKPFDFNLFIAYAASPTPGNMTFSEFNILL